LIADAPRQSPKAGGLSAARFEAAVCAADELNGKGCAVIGAGAGFERRGYGDEFERPARRLLLLTVCRRLPGAQAGERDHCNECYSSQFDSLDSVEFLHEFWNALIKNQ